MNDDEREIAIAIARRQAATSRDLAAVIVFEVQLSPQGRREFLELLGHEAPPIYLTISKDAVFQQRYDAFQRMLPTGTTLTEVYRATPPQWN